MQTITTLSSALLLAGLLQGPLPAPTAPPTAIDTAEAVLERHVEVTGGREAYARAAPRTSRGTVLYESLDAISTLTIHETRSTDRRWSSRSETLGDQEEGSSGEVAWTWSHMAGPRVLTGASLAHALRAAPLDAPARWRELFVRVDYVGTEELDGRRVDVVELVPEKGKSEKRYYDAETGLHVQTKGYLELEGNFMPAVTTYADYRAVDELLVPHSIRQSYGRLHELTIELTDVASPAKELPASTFEPPAAVRALLDR